MKSREQRGKDAMRAVQRLASSLSGVVGLVERGRDSGALRLTSEESDSLKGARRSVRLALRAVEKLVEGNGEARS